MVLIILLTIPIGGLAIFHLMLIIRGRTTNEQVTGKFKSNINPVRIFDCFIYLFEKINFSLIMDVYLIAQKLLHHRDLPGLLTIQFNRSF